MKRVSSILFLSLFFLSACSKDAAEEEMVTSQSQPYISDWSQGGTWARQDSAGLRTFSFSQPIDPLNDAVVAKGTVLVFTRNLPQASSFGVAAPSATLGMPFDAYPDSERRYRQSWYYTHRTGSVEVRYTTNEESVVASDATPDSGIRFRYFVIPESFMQANNLTAAEVKRLNYDALCALCKVNG